MFKVPVFETQNLILRSMSESDIPSYKKHFVDYEVIAHLSAVVPWPYPDDGVKEFLTQFIFPNQGKVRWDWGIYLKSAPDELVGSIGIWKPGTPENRGFWLGRKFWGNGYMVEAASAIMDYAFNVIGFEKLTFSNALGNVKSRRIKEKTGARLVGTRPMKFVDAKYSEAETWELRREDWEKFKEEMNKL